MKIEIYDILHKVCKIPNDSFYIPIQSGCAVPGCKILDFQRDDIGDNISEKNKAYNNLCPMYWVWKNSKADYVGIVHYRRLFSNKKNIKKGWNNVLKNKEIEELCSNNKIILNKKSFFPFFTLRTHYINTFKGLKRIHKNDLDTMRKIISEIYPDFLEAHDKVMNRSWGHLGNIYIMKKDLYDEHCQFMFDILFECEKRLQGKRHNYNRYIAALAEFIPDIWIEKNNYNYIELPLFMPEEPLLLRRIVNLLKRMFFGGIDPHRYKIEDLSLIEKNNKDFVNEKN